MHARIDELLSLRDGEPVSADVLRHAAACAACGAELRRLQSLREQMQALPMLDAPASAWQRISAAATGERPRVVHARRQFAAAAAVVATLSVLVAVAVRDDGSGGAMDRGVPVLSATREIAEVEAPKDVAALVALSQRLDDLLQILPPRPSVERVSTTATVEGLEARVQLVDLQLSSDGGLDRDQARQLWRERVDLMDSLVKVRYAEAGQISF
jgi:hypothetical protein